MKKPNATLVMNMINALAMAGMNDIILELTKGGMPTIREVQQLILIIARRSGAPVCSGDMLTAELMKRAMDKLDYNNHGHFAIYHGLEILRKAQG